jgi:hypothetical protein
MIDQIETQTEDSATAEMQKRFDDQEVTFQRTLTCHKTLRDFFNKHREAIGPFWMEGLRMV